MRSTEKNRNRFLYGKVFLGGVLIYLLAVLPFLIKYRGLFFYYGDYNVQQVPFLIFAHRAVRRGQFFWNPLVDLGGNMTGTFAFYLWGSPFFWLTIPFPETWLPYMMPVLMALKCGTAAASACAWIRTQTRTDRAAVLGGLLYAFSGFQACNIVFQHFHDVTALFPLYLLAFDRFVESRRRSRTVPASSGKSLALYGFTLMTAWMSVVNYYFFFGQVIFFVLYYLTRYGMRFARTEGILPVLREILQILAAGAAGLLLSAFFLVQSIGGILGNTRVSKVLNGYDLVAYPDSVTPLAILRSFFMVPDLIARGTLFTNDNIRNGSLAFYLPCFAMAGVFAFWQIRRRSWKKTLLSVLAVMAFVPVLCASFSAFNANFYTRWFYMPVLLCACVTAEALEEEETAAFTRGTILSLACTGLFLLCGFLPVYEKGKWSFTAICENRRLLVTEMEGTLFCAAVLAVILFLKRRSRGCIFNAEEVPEAGSAEGAAEAGQPGSAAEAVRAENTLEAGHAENAAEAIREEGTPETADTESTAEGEGTEGSGAAYRGRRIFSTGNLVLVLTALCCVTTSMAVLHNGTSLISYSGYTKWKQQLFSDGPLKGLEDNPAGGSPEGLEGNSTTGFPEWLEGNPAGGSPEGLEGNPAGGSPEGLEGNPAGGFPEGLEGNPTGGSPEGLEGESSYGSSEGLEGDSAGEAGAPFCRVETDSTSTNYEMVWGYPTMHCFESTVHPSIFRWYRGIGMIRTVESTLPMERIGARALMSVRYYLENTLVRSDSSYSDGEGMQGYDLVSEGDSYNVYETINYIPMGFSFDSYMTEEDYDLLDNGVVSDRVLVRDIILSDEMAEKYGGLLERDTDTDPGEMPYWEFSALCGERAAGACTEFNFEKNGFRARAQMERDNLLLFSVPYDPGFSVTIDGEPAEVERADFGLTAIFVPEGTHEIRVTYLPQGLLPCVCISLLTAAGLAAHALLGRKRRQAADA